MLESVANSEKEYLVLVRVHMLCNVFIITCTLKTISLPRQTAVVFSTVQFHTSFQLQKASVRNRKEYTRELDK